MENHDMPPNMALKLTSAPMRCGSLAPLGAQPAGFALLPSKPKRAQQFTSKKPERTSRSLPLLR
jgi:hypothetical protein